MSGADTEPLHAYVVGPDRLLRAGVAGLLARTEVLLAAGPRITPDTVVVAVAATVDDAVAAYGPTGTGHQLLVADTFTPAGVVHALRQGVRAMVRTRDATPQRLAAAVGAARHGDGRLPYEVLVRTLTALAGPEATDSPVVPTAVPGPPGAPPLTARQTAVLALMAEGHGNAAIARSLVCSQHTVKNVIYDLMARLQVRNRAHAVARAVRAGLI